MNYYKTLIGHIYWIHK